MENENKGDSISKFERMLKFAEPSQISPELRSKLEQGRQKQEFEDLLPEIFEIINGSYDEKLQIATIQLLGEIPSEKVIKPLLDIAMDTNDKEKLKASIRSIGKHQNEVALDTLNKIVFRSDEEEIIQLGTIAIQVIQGISDPSDLETE